MPANRHRFSSQLTVPSRYSSASCTHHRIPTALLLGFINVAAFQPQVFAQKPLNTDPVLRVEPEVAAELCYGSAETLANVTITTSHTICQTGLTPPSLWWTRDQVAQQLRTSRKLVKDWTAELRTEHSPGTVSLIVNPQMWSLMDYFERYDFINSFGLTARDFGYETEVYNTKSQRLVAYRCRFEAKPVLAGHSCTIEFDSSDLGIRRAGGRRQLP